MTKNIMALAFVLLAVGCAVDHDRATPMCEGRSFASLRNECPGYAQDMCNTCPDAEDAFYVASARLGCGCPVFDCGAWWPLQGSPEVYESALSCSDLSEMMHDPRPWVR